ncbi:MAG: undecaprenyldiphospho-muramoylpentapeptide beta-N-acetylglucosaminyltransferase [Oscillospiraceae bacterium]|nr:undecaprenyldiphospho-muramoylpentapeptide beta-N-acetylglucosaminyltransferase [Oscillospiraceae bacterium]
MKIMIACGGTGGHINPGLAIADIIRGHMPDAEILFVGTPDGMEAELIPAAGYEMDYVHASGIQRSISLENVRRNARTVRYMITGGIHAFTIVKRFRPELVIGTGGYASAPVLNAAQAMHIPTVLHEQNAFPGVTNKLLARRAAAVMMTFAEAEKYFPHGTKAVMTGLPVRGSMTKKNREQARRQLGVGSSMTIVSFGGSQGAKCLNDMMPDIMKWHLDSEMDIRHIHAYGKHGRDSFPEALKERGIADDPRLRVTEYIHDMDVCLAAADLIISRAGASTLSELEAVGRASILIPYPAAAENHQYYNAMVLGKAGAAVVIEQKNLTPDLMKEHIAALYRDPEKRLAMHQRAGALFLTDTNDRIWNVISDILGNKT